MVFSPEMVDVSSRLKSLGHGVILPEFTNDYAKLNSRQEMHTESAQNKIKFDLIRGYFHKIKDSDAVLIYQKNDAHHGLKAAV